MKNINATTIGNLISAHYEEDNDKFDAWVKFIIEAYEEQGEQRKADIIRKRADGSYKNESKVVLDMFNRIFKDKNMRDEEIEKIIEGDKDYSDLSMLVIILPMIVFAIAMFMVNF